MLWVTQDLVTGLIMCTPCLFANPFPSVSCLQALAGMLSQLLLRTPPEVAQKTLDAVLKQQQSQAEGSGAVMLPAGTQDTQAAVEKGE